MLSTRPEQERFVVYAVEAETPSGAIDRYFRVWDTAKQRVHDSFADEALATHTAAALNAGEKTPAQRAREYQANVA